MTKVMPEIVIWNTYEIIYPSQNIYTPLYTLLTRMCYPYLSENWSTKVIPEITSMTQVMPEMLIGNWYETVYLP